MLDFWKPDAAEIDALREGILEFFPQILDGWFHVSHNIDEVTRTLADTALDEDAVPFLSSGVASGGDSYVLLFEIFGDEADDRATSGSSLIPLIGFSSDLIDRQLVARVHEKMGGFHNGVTDVGFRDIVAIGTSKTWALLFDAHRDFGTHVFVRKPPVTVP